MRALLLWFATSLTIAARADIVINEVHYAPDPKTLPHEFIELQNTGDAAMDLGGWSLTSGVSFTFPAGTMLDAGSYLLLSGNPAALTAAYFPPPANGSATYDYATVPNGSAFPGTTLTGQDGWVEPAGGTGVKVRNDINVVPGFSGNNAYNSAAGVYATRKNNAAFGYAIPASTTTLKLSLVGRINGTATAAFGPGCDANNNGSINSANALGEYGFEFGYQSNTWFIRQAAQGTVTQSPNLGLGAGGHSWYMELRVDLTANAGDGAGSLYVKQLGDTGNNPVNDTLTAVPSLQNINLRIKRMTANGGNSSPTAWNGILTRVGAGNIDALHMEWSGGTGSNPPQMFTFTGGLSNEGEQITLRDANGVVHDQVDYQAEFPWPVAAAGDGPSMQLIHPGLDNDLGGSWRSAAPTPGAMNAVFAANAPPQLRQVEHFPSTPAAGAPVTVSVKATDPDGVGSVSLSYQVVTPGSYIPAFLPLPYSQFVASPSTPRTANPAFEDPANWTSIAMLDDGLNGDALAGDGIFTAAIPGQPNRTLLRYRISAVDALAASVRIPHADDPSLNFACFVYNGVPAYTAGTRTVRPEGIGYTYPAVVMNSLPVHTLITRPEDLKYCNAYSSLGDSGLQIPKSNDAARSAFNWEGAFVHEGVVYDHMRYRLRQANDRYAGDGKRSMRFRFNRGHYFQARDHEDKKVKEKWESINTGKMSRFGGANVSGLREVVNAELWRLFGVDMPHYYHAHFRVIDGAEEAPAGTNGQYLGDFFGLAMFYEDFEGSFLDNRDLPDGNVYKWKDGFTNPATLQQFQASDAVTDGSDFNAIYQQLRPERDSAWLRQRVDWDNWYRYHGIVEAVRHYDFGVTSAHLKNRGWYFMPAAGAPLGLLRHIPHDHDATWYRGYHDGLTVGIGVDFPMQAIYGYNGVTEKAEFTTEYRNVLRELRDLLWRQEVVNPMIDRTAARISAFHDADRDRWLSAPATAGFEAGVTPLATVVSEMKNFAFVADTVNGATLNGGRGTYLEQLANDSAIPATPAITYTGTAGYPSNGVSFQASAYSGTNTAAAIEWRLAEITDPAAPAYDPLAPQMYEITAMWQVKNAAPFSTAQTIPMLALRPGHTYRLRARHTDATNRVSHWSAPVQFTVALPNVSLFQQALVISEVNYNPAPTTQAERDAGFLDSDLFEWIEVKNVSDHPVDMTGLRFTKGADFDFPSGWTIPPGGFVLAVKDLNAFRQRWGTLHDTIIAGSYGSANLSNAGEEIKLSYGAGTEVRAFTYDDSAPWPEAADGTGKTMVLISPDSRPEHTRPENWRASAAPCGSPGANDLLTYSGWAAQFPGIGDANANPDGDELSNRLEYAFQLHPLVANPLPFSARVESADGTAGQFLTITFKRRSDAADLVFTPQFGTRLDSWTAATIRLSAEENSDGTVTETWRSDTPVSSTPRLFARIKVE
jgi:hypothetical protein